MNAAPEKSGIRETEKCLARSVADTFAAEPALEAVTIDAAREKISVATLGKTDVEKLTQRLTEKFHSAQTAECSLLNGKNECDVCGSPLSQVEREKFLIRHEGATTTIARQTCPTAPKFWRWRDVPFPKVVPREIEIPEDDHADEWKAQLAAAILCGIFGVAGFLVGQASSLSHLKIVFFALAYVAGGFFPAEEVWERLQKRAIDIHFLMLFVAVGAASIGAWAEGATLLFLFSLAGALEHFALGRTQKEIRALFRATPKFAVALDAQNRECEVRVEEIRAGIKLLVKPGEQFAVDGEIFRGATAADESNLTGEATPAEKNIGDLVLAGTINLWGAVEMIATKPAAQSALQRIIKLIREAQQQKAPAQQFTDKFGGFYTYFVIGLSAAMFFVWWLGYHLPPFKSAIEMHSAFYRAMTLLVVSSPCALVLSIPSAVLAAIAQGARHGILFRGGIAVEKLAEINVVALDKTGTLTTGELRVETIESFPPGRENEIAQLACALEKLSTHPLARAITRHGKQKKLAPLALENFESLTGHGLRARFHGVEVQLGRRDWLATGQRAKIISQVPATRAGFSEVWIAHGDLIGRIILRDDIREQAEKILKDLRAENLKTVVLTGDREATAQHLREKLNLEDVRAELKPENKVEAIHALSANGKKVAMIGDGVNDAPSLAAAYVGVAMGARGSDAALEQADVVLMNDRLENFLAAFHLSRRARKIIQMNLVISLGTIAVLVCCAMLGKIPLTVGVVGHEGSTVVVVMNSLRLLFGGTKK